MIRMKKTKTQIIWILYSFTPSDMNFQTILMPKVILAKILSEKILPFNILMILILYMFQNNGPIF